MFNRNNKKYMYANELRYDFRIFIELRANKKYIERKIHQKMQTECEKREEKKAALKK